jgi:hypothetical protein
MKNPSMILGFIETTPLPVFLIYAVGIDKSITQNWQGPFVASSIVAILTMTILLYNKVILNRLMIGINSYLITGSLGLFTKPDWIHQVYGKLEASGMLAWIIIVGVISLLISPAGFIGVTSQDRRKVVMSSLYLLLVALGAFFVSWYFQGNKLYAEFIPFIALFSARSFWHRKMTTPMLHDPRTS